MPQGVGYSNWFHKGMARRGPEARLRDASRDLMRSGGAVRSEGTAAIRGFDPSDYLGADALRAVFDEATRTNFLPQLRGLQARNARRGIRGKLAGATEGDLASAFQRNLLARTAEFGAERGRMAFNRGRELAEIGGTDRAQGLSLLGTELELKMARDAEKARKRSGWGGLLGGALGGLAGSFIPGVGTGLGASIGSRLGGAVS